MQHTNCFINGSMNFLLVQLFLATDAKEIFNSLRDGVLHPIVFHGCRYYLSTIHRLQKIIEFDTWCFRWFSWTYYFTKKRKHVLKLTFFFLNYLCGVYNNTIKYYSRITLGSCFKTIFWYTKKQSTFYLKMYF